MVSLSRDEMLKNMVENYGFGSSLFCQLEIDDLERIQYLFPDFEIYLDNLLQGKIHDPLSKKILEEKYNNDLWLHYPQELEYEISSRDWRDLKDFKEDLERLASELNIWIEKDFQDETRKEYKIRKGDVLYVFCEEADLMGYFIMDTKFRCVYLKVSDLELDIPVSGEFDMLGDTPANYWEIIQIPKLSFYFDLQGYFQKIKWEKLNQENQNYLVGSFQFQKRKIHLYVPINESTQEATKLAIGLNLQNQMIFYPKDPKQIVDSEPERFFAMPDLNLYVFEKEDDQDEQDDYLLDYKLD
jgi:hypothetical protein